ncbi:MAG: class I SAM-dependent methyltransferase [Planctomycetes bacterium]|nr:class I SAM-dependent methyltransferase [Planctomycetota bacterium]
MPAKSLRSFRCPSTHETVSTIIRQRSTNRTDVRDAALQGLDLSSARQVLELGCGFGFMAETVARRAAADAQLVGVDAWQSNEQPFLSRVAAAGRQGQFICSRIGASLPCPDRSFDLVVCSYSLYFFVEALPDIARVLAPNGLLVAVTHSEQSFDGLLHAVGVPAAESLLPALLRRFSAENGERLLRRWFDEVGRSDYPNVLRFEPEHLNDLLTYVHFKLPLLRPGWHPGDEMPGRLVETVRRTLALDGSVDVEKDDAVFLCRRPRWP